MSTSGRRRWIAPAAVLIAAGGIAVAAGAYRSGSAASPAASVQVQLPSTVDPPLEVWDVAARSSVADPAPPAFLVTVSAQVTLPKGAHGLDVRIDGSGVFTPQTATRVADPADRQAIRWRWAVPLRDRPPPYPVPVTVTASYSSAGRTHRVTTTAMTRVTPPPAPEGTPWVSDLGFDFAVNGYGPIRRDHSVSGILADSQPPLVLAGKHYEKGIGTNSRSVLGIHLGGACTRFRADVGVDDSSGSGGTVSFAVIGDGRTLVQTPIVTGSSATRPLDVDVSGIRQLNLQVGTGGDGQGNDHADWAGARLDCE